MSTPLRSALIVMVASMLFASCGNRTEDPALLERKVRTILELPTYEQVYRDIVYVDRERSFLVFRTMHAEVLFSIDIRVQAGFDLAEGISISHGPDRRSVTVRLPDAKILLVDADETTIKQYFLKESGGGLDRLDYYDEIDRVKGQIRTDAINREILAKAAENARRMISGLLTAAGYREVRFAPL